MPLFAVEPGPASGVYQSSSCGLAQILVFVIPGSRRSLPSTSFRARGEAAGTGISSQTHVTQRKAMLVIPGRRASPDARDDVLGGAASDAGEDVLGGAAPDAREDVLDGAAPGARDGIVDKNSAGAR